ncbi:hypothetical protein AJ80_04964 [Polytolypa hystricis UAMH7299]|uniref:DNA polymerase delta subunit 4 n=1 Tax=Polytolypa hystricis (strain UAMH7299) TaxID=1447883 RepID=A0A2B7Y7Q8_POLH7|nr:hypothetical protein AJ80_04964 [Polytolypa hystricis UAMH7299]
MPPTRRRSGNAAISRNSPAQSTISFGAKSKISKPTSGHLPGKKAKDVVDVVRSVSPESAKPVTSDIEEPAQEKPTPGSSRSELAVREQARVAIRQPKSAEDLKAETLTDKDIKLYWTKEEENRIAPRVHQEDLSLDEKILRHFDLSNQYGPCIGIARIKRWRRAHSINLNPPIEVLAVLLKEEAKGNANEKAYIDELLS